MDVSLKLADVLARRAKGWPEVHITVAADELLTHLLAAGEDVLTDKEGAFMTLARIGAQAIMTGVGLEGPTGSPVDIRDGRALVDPYSASRVTPFSVCSC